MSTFAQDLKFAVRTLRKSWGVTLVAVLSLALAIGGNAAVFSMVDAFLFRPLPFDEPERLVLFGERPDDLARGNTALGMSLPTWADLRERTRTLEGWAAAQPRTLSLRGEDRSQPVTARLVTSNFFEMVGARAARGRTFLPQEGVEGARKVVMISEELREERWGDGYPLGEVITLNSEPHEIVGILPPDFAFLSAGVDVWLPLTRSPYGASRDERNSLVLARMAPSANMEQVRAEVHGVAEQLQTEHPEVQGHIEIDAYNLRYDVPVKQTKILFGLLQGIVLVVLVIACVNITNVLLARSRDRGREIALRTVLGAGRWRIVRQLLTESLTLGFVGGLLGLGLGKLGIAAIARNFAGILPASFSPTLDLRVLGFTLVIAVGAGLLFGLAPALQTLRADHATTLREGHGRGGGGGGRKRLSRVLVVAEIALSMVALGVGSLLVRSFLELRSSTPGYDGRDVLVATLAVPPAKYPEDDDKRLLSDRILERVGEMTGVQHAALTSSLPQGFGAPGDSARIPGRTGAEGRTDWRVTRIAASPEYLRAMDIELLQGRFFQDRDREDGPPVAAVNRELAESRFPDQSPLGRRIVVGGTQREIVGVVANVQQQLLTTARTSPETVYVPQAQSPALANLVLEVTGDPHDLVNPLRDEVQIVDVDLTLPTVLTMDEYVDQAFVGIRVFNSILGGFGTMALFLAALGTYGVLSYSVSQRRHEIGVRMALGADPGKVVGMISRQGFWLGAIGLAIGLLATLPMIGVIQSLLTAFGTVKSSTLVFIAAVLAGVTAAASWIPARRAALVNPVDTLKEE